MRPAFLEQGCWGGSGMVTNVDTVTPQDGQCQSRLRDTPFIAFMLAPILPSLYFGVARFAHHFF